MTLPRLTSQEQRLLSGDAGRGIATAMELIVEAAALMQAPRLQPISHAHVASCFWTGRTSRDFAAYLVERGARVAVPTTMNVSYLDRRTSSCPGRAEPSAVREAREMMNLYERLGCEPTWTCAPYHLPDRPRFGAHVAVSESNAIVFTNSVLGARTNKMVEFLDTCAAITGRVPFAGLHTPEARRGQIVYDLRGLGPSLWQTNIGFHALGHYIGRTTGEQVPIIVGLPPTTAEDQLKALGAAAASSGSVCLFHAVGVTPEAQTLAMALRGTAPERTIEVRAHDLRRACASLSSAPDGRLGAVCLGTPHFSIAEFRALLRSLGGRAIHPELKLYVSTSRAVARELRGRGWGDSLDACGVDIVEDTCTYYGVRRPGFEGGVMTNSAKWGYYGPGLLGVPVTFGSLKECVESAIRGHVWRDPTLWANNAEAGGA